MSDALPSIDTEGARFRQRRWEDLGRPDVNPTHLEFLGPDAQRAIVVDVLSRLPPAVRHFAVEGAIWVGINADSKAWTSIAPTPRVLPGDLGQIFVVRAIDSGVIGHEIGHGWTRLPLDAAPERCGLDEQAVAIERMPAQWDEAHRVQWVAQRVEREWIADLWAEAWGIPHKGLTPMEIAGEFLDRYDAMFAAKEK